MLLLSLSGCEIIGEISPLQHIATSPTSTQIAPGSTFQEYVAIEQSASAPQLSTQIPATPSAPTVIPYISTASKAGPSTSANNETSPMHVQSCSQPLYSDDLYTVDRPMQQSNDDPHGVICSATRSKPSKMPAVRVSSTSVSGNDSYPNKVVRKLRIESPIRITKAKRSADKREHEMTDAKFCSISNCKSIRFKTGCIMYHIPKVTKKNVRERSFARNAAWLKIIGGEEFSEAELKNVRVCSKHFVSGKVDTNTCIL